ncbi:MAG: thioredoxin family protein [Epulopiscium sp.]|nr:thioredoxin family protein [Candidatus Epulonipiscium sp.]
MMVQLQSWEELEEQLHIRGEQLILLYFTSQTCPVCHVLLPKVQELALAYPEVLAVHIDIEQVPKAQGTFMVFSAPTVVLLWDQKEILRRSTFIQVAEVEQYIKKYLFFTKDTKE